MDYLSRDTVLHTLCNCCFFRPCQDGCIYKKELQEVKADRVFSAGIWQMHTHNAYITEPITLRERFIYYSCSNCGYETDLRKNYTPDMLPDFCPKCGADMRGEDYV